MKHVIVSLLAACICTVSIAQTKLVSEKINVSGNCKSCKKHIEAAAKEAGASVANWDVDTKVLSVKFDGTKTSDKKIEAKIAAVGYDTQDVKATDESYKKLEECCQYDRKKAAAKQ